MLSQRLRHRVDIESLTVEHDSNTGAADDVWLPKLVEEPADVVPLSGTEYIAAQAVQAGVTTRITLRVNPFVPVLPTDRVVHMGLLYNIRAVLPDPKLNQYINCMCSSGVNNG